MSETKKQKLISTLQDFKDIFGVLPIMYVKTCSTPFGNSKETISFLADKNKNDIMQKVDYDLEAYDDDLRHKHQPKIRILRVEFNENKENRSGIAVNFNQQNRLYLSFKASL